MAVEKLQLSCPRLVASRMRTVLAKLRNLLLLVVVFLVGLELVLQAAHFAFFAEPDETLAAPGGARFRVLCVGESTTVGYPHGHRWPSAYPRILQHRLEEEFPSLSFQVVNRGLNAVTSSQIVEKLPGWLERHEPHVVVAMLGANDVFYESLAYENAVPVRLILALQNLRSYRLAGLARVQLRRLRAPPPAPQPRIPADAYRRILGVYEQAAALYERGELATAEERFERLRQLIDERRSGMAVDPGLHAVSRLPGRLLGPYHEATTYLGEIYFRRGRPAEAIRLYREAIAAEPELPILHFELANLYAKLRREEEAERERARGDALLARYVLRSTQENYRRIRALTAAQGAALVAMQYPLRDVDNLKVLFADRGGVHFVDNRGTFAEVLERAPFRDYFSDRFAGDFGHLTHEGNALLVENLLEQALRELVSRWAEQ